MRFDGCEVFASGRDSHALLLSDFSVCHLTAAKADGDFDFVTIVEKFSSVFQLYVEIVLIGFRTKFDLLDGDRSLGFRAAASFFFFSYFIFP